MIATLVIPSPFDIDRFLATLAQGRGKPIKLIASGVDADLPCGMLVSTDKADYIYFADNVPSLQSQHTVMHEVGHLLFNHGTTQPGSGANPWANGHDAFQLLLPNLSPTLVQRILGGHNTYAAEQEREAELFASLVLTRVSTSREQYPGMGPEGAEDLARLESAFGHPVRPWWTA